MTAINAKPMFIRSCCPSDGQVEEITRPSSSVVVVQVGPKVPKRSNGPMKSTPRKPPGGTSVPISLSRVVHASEIQSRTTPTGQNNTSKTTAAISNALDVP